MNLFDLIKPKKKNVFQEYAENMQPLPRVAGANSAGYTPDGSFAQTQEIPIIQIQDDNIIAPAEKRPSRLRGIKGKLTSALFGDTATPTDNTGMQDGVLNVTVSENPRVGGFIPDFTNGMRENFATGFAAPNLFDNQTSDGRNKGWAYRLGEGIGSIGRFLESSPGRALLTAGAVGLSGGNGAEALAYGLQAGSLNNRLRTQDRMYREEMYRNSLNSLQNSPEFMLMSDEEKQQAITNLQNQINNNRGYVTDDIYKNIVTAQQLRDNADYRNLMANLQMQNNQALQDFRKDQAEYQRQKDVADREDRALTRAITARGQDMNYGLGMARLQADAIKDANKAASKQSVKQQDAMSTLKQIDLIREMVKQNPKATGLAKGMVTGDLLNRFDSNPNNIQTRTAIDALRTKIRHDLTGAQFSPKEAREYEKFLPNVKDNEKIINAKLDALEKRYMADFGVSLSGSATTSKKIGKYTVRVK